MCKAQFLLGLFIEMDCNIFGHLEVLHFFEMIYTRKTTQEHNNFYIQAAY